MKKVVVEVVNRVTTGLVKKSFRRAICLSLPMTTSTSNRGVTNLFCGPNLVHGLLPS